MVFSFGLGYFECNARENEAEEEIMKRGEKWSKEITVSQ